MEEKDHGKTWRISGGNARKYGESHEAGAEDAAPDGRAVEVTVSGAKKVLKVKLDEEAVDPDDVEMLEDMIVAAVNEALEKVDQESAAGMSKFTGGMGGGMPGLF